MDDERMGLPMAYCGLNCANCPPRISRMTVDRELQERTVARWGDPEYPVRPEDIDCEGCKAEGMRYKWCDSCLICSCASERNLDSCGPCPDYGCQRMERVMAMVDPVARKNLEEIRARTGGPCL